MGRKSTIIKLDPKIRAEIDRLIREDSYTVDSLLETLKSMGGTASRSAVGRYAKNAEENLAKIREMDRIAKQWVGDLKDAPEGDRGRMLNELLRMIIYQQMDRLSGDNKTNPMDVMLIAKAMKDLAGTDKLTIERIETIRELARAEAAREAAKRAEQFATTEGLTAAQTENLRKTILGKVA